MNDQASRGEILKQIPSICRKESRRVGGADPPMRGNLRVPSHTSRRPDATAALEKAAADIPLTRSARDILERAAATATLRGSLQTDPEDVLVAISKSTGSLAEKTMRSL